MLIEKTSKLTAKENLFFVDDPKRKMKAKEKVAKNIKGKMNSS